jgi:hypothetical protein
MSRLLTRPTLATTSPSRPESAKTAASSKHAPCPRQGRSERAAGELFQHPASGVVGPTLFMSGSAAIAGSPLRQAWTQRPGRWARRLVGQHTVSRMHPSLADPRACLAWRLRDFATNRHE